MEWERRCRYCNLSVIFRESLSKWRRTATLQFLFRLFDCIFPPPGYFCEGEFYEGLFLCAGPPWCYSLAGSLDSRSTAASAHRSGAPRRVRAVVLDREAVVFRRTWVLNRTMYLIVVPPSMFSRFKSSCTCLIFSYCDFIFMLSFSLTSLEVCFRALLV